MDILYSETKINMNWNEVIREIKADVKGFVEDGGWAFLQDDLSQVESEEEKISNPDDSEFKASEIEEEEEEESDYSSEDDAEEEDDEDAEEEAEDDEDEEEFDEEDEESEEEPRRKNIPIKNKK